MLLALPWHFWMALPLVAGAILFVVACIVGYLVKVERPKHPPRAQRS
jgi:uncharacterized membrane protein YpjA